MSHLLSEWQGINQDIQQLRKQQKNAESALAFRFVEGTLVQALRNGDWVLLDEINLATPETLECLCGLLESSSGSVVLMERGSVFITISKLTLLKMMVKTISKLFLQIQRPQSSEPTHFSNREMNE